MYEELVKQLRELPHLLFVQLHGHEDVVFKAADVIEELQQTVSHYKGCADDWYKEACDYKAMLPRWIPVTERLPESSGKYLVSGGGKVWICDFWRIAGVRGWCDSVNNPVVGYWMPLPPEPPKEEAYRDFKPITNYKRLVAKSPKELVEWINSVESDARYYGPKGKDVWLKWLQEVNE